MRIATLAAAFAAAALAAAAPAAAFDLTGTWHVLVHYKDKVAHNVDAERWEDRVWVFEREGDRLRWVDYPLVVLSDETGRFERLSTNRASRTLAYWTPTPAQQAELARGPKVNSRGSKSKTLKKTDQGWASANAHQESAGFITYEETWSVTGPPDRPVFSRTDSLGGGMAEEAEGRTLFETTEADGAGGSLRGKYDRDGNRLGTFVMTRVGAVQQLTPTTDERQRERMRDNLLDQLGRDLGTEEE